jgi:serine/threonine protein kinase
LVHRDLKPSNVLLAEDGPRVIDFGISRAAEASVLTQAGTVMGSPGYMSPEQAEGREVGPPSDVFSLGAVLTFAATGQGPFGTGATPAMIYRVVYQQPDTTRLPTPIRSVVERCLAKDPGQRPATTDLLAALGSAEPAEDWLPAPLTEVLSRYAPPTGSSGPPTMTSAQLRRTPTEAAFQAPPAGAHAQPTSADARPLQADGQPPSVDARPLRMDRQPPRTDGQPPGKKRRGPAWALLATGVLAVLVAAVILVPKAIAGSPVSRTPPPTQTSSTPGSPSPQLSQNGGAVPQSAAPTTVLPPSSPQSPPPSATTQSATQPTTTQPATQPTTTQPATQPATTPPATPPTTTPPATQPTTTPPATASSP